MIKRTSQKMTRRHLLRMFSLSTLLPWSVPVLAKKLGKTAKAAEGPYYPTPSMRSPDIDNDLVKIEQKVNVAGGEIVYLSGTVTDTESNALTGLRVEIWQCDANGRYIHTRDSNSAEPDPDFQGFGHTYTDQSGYYEFRTIKPVSYPGRTPHIHVKVFRDDTVLTTQFYIKHHPQNEKDSLFNRMTLQQQAAVEMDFMEKPGRVEASVHIVC